jgi:hypothetical protein
LKLRAVRYVPQPRRKDLIEMFSAVDLRLVASGHVHQRRDFTFGHTRHVWAPVGRLHHSGPHAGSDRHQGGRAGGVSFCARQFEVRHVRAPGQIDVGLDELLGKAT